MQATKDKDHSLRNGIIAAIAGAIALPLLAWLLGWLGTILRALGLIGRFLVASTSLPRWLIVLLVLAMLAFVFGALKRRLTAITQPLEIGLLSYTTDVFPGFDGAVWRWRYSGDSILRIVAFLSSM